MRGKNHLGHGLDRGEATFSIPFKSLFLKYNFKVIIIVCARSLVGRVYKSKRWAKRFADGRPIKKVKNGWKILAGRKK